jgi:hypothetical protein
MKRQILEYNIIQVWRVNCSSTAGTFCIKEIYRYLTIIYTSTSQGKNANEAEFITVAQERTDDKSEQKVSSPF